MDFTAAAVDQEVISMAKIKITCDSTCDLTEELYQANDVYVFQM